MKAAGSRMRPTGERNSAVSWKGSLWFCSTAKNPVCRQAGRNLEISSGQVINTLCLDKMLCCGCSWLWRAWMMHIHEVYQVHLLTWRVQARRGSWCSEQPSFIALYEGFWCTCASFTSAWTFLPNNTPAPLHFTGKCNAFDWIRLLAADWDTQRSDKAWCFAAERRTSVHSEQWILQRALGCGTAGTLVI